MTLRIATSTVLAFRLVLAVATAQAPQPPVPRIVVVIRDQTSSFARFVGEANAAIARIVEALGPADTFVLIELGGVFNAQTQVFETSLMPVPAAACQRPATWMDYQRMQAVLDARWTSARRAKAAILEMVARHVPARNGTDIPAVLDYAAHRLQEFDGEKRLILVSDLETDIRGTRTGLPPRQRYPFAAVAAHALFVPWHGSSQAGPQLQAWQAWFAAAGASSFQMYDEARSRTVSVLAASGVPARAISPFAR